MRGLLALVTLLHAIAATSLAQLPNRTLRSGVLTPFADGGVVGEVLALRGPSETHPSVAGGLYLGGGLEAGRWMVGVGLEGYILVPAGGVDGLAGSFAITNAFHLRRDHHVDALFAVGYSGYALASPPTPELGFNALHSGLLVRTGFSREHNFGSLESVVYSAEVELRPSESGPTIRSPSLRLGITWRSRIQSLLQVPRGGFFRPRQAT